MESMHSNITPAPQGNIALPLHGEDTTFQRGESPAGVASSPEACLAQGRLMAVASWAAGGREICSVENFFFVAVYRHLACSQKQQKVTVASAAFL